MTGCLRVSSSVKSFIRKCGTSGSFSSYRMPTVSWVQHTGLTHLLVRVVSAIEVCSRTKLPTSYRLGQRGGTEVAVLSSKGLTSLH